jgi:thiol:disulfide interchange protein DsbD
MRTPSPAGLIAPVLSLSLAVLLLLLGSAWLPTAARAEDERVAASVALEPSEAQPGDEVELRVTLAAVEGWHIYSTTTPQGLPTVVELQLPAGLERVGELSEPHAEREEIEYVGEVEIHRGEAVFVQRLRVGADAAPGTLTVPVTTSWQTCDDANTACVTGEAQLTATLRIAQAAAASPPEDSADPVGGGEPFGLPGGLFDDGPVVTWTASLSRPSARPGETIEVVLEATIADGWHIYGTQASKGTPTQVQFNAPPPTLGVGDLLEPTPEVEPVPEAGEQPLHRGTVRFVLPIQGTKAGSLELKGTVIAQACDDANTSCKDAPFDFALALEVAGEPVADAAVLRAPASSDPSQAKDPTGSLGGLAWASLVLGIFMLLQPCTYPMIPITVSIFSKGKELSRARSVTRAGVYAVGIVVSFVLVAGVVQVAFGAQGQGTLSALATNPWVNLVIGALFVYFAFSFFGYYELGLPEPLMNLMQFGQAKQASDGTVPAWSLFLMGFFFVLTSYTCGAPVVLAVFATAAQEPHPAAVVFSTFVFACTVAAPYFVLSLIPGAVRALPKSGSWFSVFKAVLGFLEIGFALKFLRGADVMWETHLLTREVIYGLWTLLSVGTAVYLVGFLPFKFPHDPPLRPVTRQRVGWAVLFLALGGYFGAGMAGHRLLGPIETFLLVEPDVDPGLKDLTAEQLAERLEIPLEQAQVVIAARDAGKPMQSLEEIQAATGFDAELSARILDLGQRRIAFGPPPPEGEPDTRLRYRLDLEAVEELKRVGTDKPLFLIFTGHNCVNCIAMENGIMQEPEVAARLALAERVALFTDMPGDPVEEANKRYMLEVLKNPGTIPAFYIVNDEGEVLAEQIAGTTTAEAFIRFLEEGGLKLPVSK